MAPRGRTNPLALTVLVLLTERRMHPYEMSATLRERRKEDSIKLNYGSLYAVVESLQKRGLVEATETVRDGKRPERTVYAITEAGSEEMLDWLTDLIANPVKEYPQFEAALSLLPTLPPDRALELLETRLKTLRETDRTIEANFRAMDGTMPRLFLVEAEFAHALLRAELEFVDKLVGELRRGELVDLRLWRRIHELRRAGTMPEDLATFVTEEFGGEEVRRLTGTNEPPQ
ncbi:PadR family transcriptional regulator [Amycolatopsis minnesotensis]|uniref:PadR family transcriptional regulator n=1 Tax=Amycolatopsis minnesotensis TaxID=337894 RepID=A0ABN2QZS3_9PSEU